MSVRDTGRTSDGAPWPELVIFDCDGVLVDSEAISLTRLRAALARAGLAPRRSPGARPVRRRQRALDGEIAERALGAPLPAGFHADLARDLLADFERELVGMEGLGEAVAALRARVCVCLVELAGAHPRLAAHRRLCRPVRRRRVFRDRGGAGKARAGSVPARRPPHGR